MASKSVLEQKEQIVEGIKAKISAASSIVLVDYKGLTVAQDTEMRKKFRESGVDYQVLKNRLVKIAFNELGYTQFDEALNGPTAVAFGSTDIAAPAKIAVDSVKAYNKMAVKCGYVDGTFLNEDGVKELAAIPSREVLLAKRLGSMLAPISKLAYVLDAIKEQKGGATEAAAE